MMPTPPADPFCHPGNPQPLFITIGPSAMSALKGTHPTHTDLALVDLFLCMFSLSDVEHDLAAVAERLDRHRYVIVCLFDGRDEAWWSAAERVVAIARQRTVLPLFFAYSHPSPPRPDHSTWLRKLACKLDVCIIDAPREPSGLLCAAFLPLAPLRRPSIAAVSGADLGNAARPPSVGHAAFWSGLATQAVNDAWERVRVCLREPEITDVLVTIADGAQTRLADLSALCSRIAGVVPNAEIMVSIPMSDQGRPEMLEVGVLALHSAEA